MAIFLCNESGCPNEGIEYNFVDGYATAECGGCKAVLTPMNEDDAE